MPRPNPEGIGITTSESLETQTGILDAQDVIFVETDILEEAEPEAQD